MAIADRPYPQLLSMRGVFPGISKVRVIMLLLLPPNLVDYTRSGHDVEGLSSRLHSAPSTHLSGSCTWAEGGGLTACPGFSLTPQSQHATCSRSASPMTAIQHGRAVRSGHAEDVWALACSSAPRPTSANATLCLPGIIAVLPCPNKSHGRTSGHVRHTVMFSCHTPGSADP